MVKVNYEVAALAVHEVVHKRLVYLAAVRLQVVVVPHLEVCLLRSGGHALGGRHLRGTLDRGLGRVTGARLLQELVPVRGLGGLGKILLAVVLLGVTRRRLEGRIFKVIVLGCVIIIFQFSVTLSVFEGWCFICCLLFWIICFGVFLLGRKLLFFLVLINTFTLVLLGLTLRLTFIILIQFLDKVFERIHQVFIQLELVVVHLFR